MKTLKCDDSALEETAAVLLAGGVAVIPTDTVYGLAAHPVFPAAVDRLYTIKGRESAKPIALLAANLESVRAFLACELPAKAEKFAAEYWPGALTMVLEKGEGTEGLRIPAHDWTRRLLARVGGVLRVTSANLSGKRPATDAPAALREVGLDADIVVDDGVSPGGIPSAVIGISRDNVVSVLREGPGFEKGKAY